MQRAFSAFPYGAAGVALLALRLVAAAQLSLRASPAAFAMSWELVVIVLMALTLTVGFATPFVAVLAVPANLLLTGLTGHWLDAGLLFECLHALILSLLGPGAYSLDAKIYGRKIVAAGFARKSSGEAVLDDPEY